MKISDEDLAAIEKNFHEVILNRARDFKLDTDFPLPDLKAFVRSGEKGGWAPVPGMYGGFSYRLVEDGDTVRLVTDSWVRVFDGLEQRHEITAEGWRLTLSGSEHPMHYSPTIVRKEE